MKIIKGMNWFGRLLYPTGALRVKFHTWGHRKGEVMESRARFLHPIGFIVTVTYTLFGLLICVPVCLFTDSSIFDLFDAISTNTCWW